MKELEPQLKREGRVFPNGMADIVPIAHPRWKELPEREKERFENMAKAEKARLRGRAGDQYRVDNVGNIIATRKDKYTELEKRRMAEKRDMVAKWPKGKDLKKEKFYFINFQYLCKTEGEDYIYLPAEIAVIEYSIEKGITRNLHRFINPGPIPTGYRFTCIQHSEDTHQIPIENFDLFDSNYRGLWIQLENFINPDRNLPENPPLYCLGASNNYDVVEHCLDWIHGRAALGEPNRIRKIYEVESLFQEMYAHIGSQVSKTQCIDRLTCSDWDYEPKTRCEYHEEKEVKHCALGVVNRYAYAISDSLCVLFDVQLTKRHFPIREDTGAITVLSPSSMPVCSKQESRLPQKPEIGFKTRDTKPPQQEEDYTELRRPKQPVPDYPDPLPAAPVWGGGRGQTMYGNQNLPPGAGRGLTVGMQGLNLNEPKPAGRGSVPRPAAGPLPPQAWQQSLPAQQPVGLGRGIMLRNQASFVPTNMEFNEEEGNMAPLRIPGQPAPDMAPLRKPGEMMTQAPQVRPTQIAHNRPLANQGAVPLPVGRGCGGLMEKLLKGRKPGVPVGRGFAPPDWEDDGSLGPARSDQLG